MSRKNNLFKHVPVARVNRNLFDLSHEAKITGKFGILYPVFLTDTIPGDTFREQMTAMVRFAPMLAPVMHRVDVTTHFFFVPNRLLNNQWENFITGGQDGKSTVVMPYISPAAIKTAAGNSNLMKIRTLWDHLGLPILQGSDPAIMSAESISAFPFLAYAKIWNDYYRDPNLAEEKDLLLNQQGNVSAAMISGNLFNLRLRGWDKDYFTSCLPFAQRGDQVLMPLAGNIDFDYKVPAVGYRSWPPAPPAAAAGDIKLDASGNLQDSASNPITLDNIDSATIDATTTINDFRRAMAIQRWLENNARGGARYVEQIESHFNVRVPDYRLQRAEYLGGGKQPVVISEVLTTAHTEVGGEEQPAADMTGHGISVGKSNRFTYRCQEHGWIMGILSIIPKPAYSQGIDKMWSRFSRFDYAFPELANLGEQEVLSKEVYFSFDQDDEPDNQEVFGYIPRYSEYKFKNDRIAGDFRDSLAFWHLGRIFTERPALDVFFTDMIENGEAEETYRRIFAASGYPEGNDYLWIQLFHRCTSKRPLPYFGVPSIT